MLVNLSVKNYALIEELTVRFERGLNIITGETGAGKSILIDALGLVLGERADTENIRSGADKAIVEAVFHVPGNGKLNQLLAANAIDQSEELILRRDVSQKGQSRCFINDTPSTIAVLKQVGDLLVDLHGQHEHQSLLRSETHIGLLDSFAGLEGLVAEFRTAYSATRTFIDDLRNLRSKKSQLLERREFYEFQLREINDVNPRAGEEEELEAELNILENSEKLFSTSERLYELLYEGENAIYDQLVLARNQLEDLASIDKAFAESMGEAASAAAIVSELARFIQSYNSRIEFNPGRLEEIRNRLGHIALLKKKYGGSLEAVISHRDEISRQVALAENFDGEISRLEHELEAQRAACSEIAERLSAKRREAAKKVNRSVEQALTTLGIPHPSFDTVIQTRKAADRDSAVVKLGRDFLEATPEGIDVVEFHISTNIGEDPKPLVKVASGGEVSRIMLALKTILAKTDRLPLLVFDEIDVGVSGRIAQAVGNNLKKLSQYHQVIAITHLPQIASLGDAHYVVEKTERGKRSSTTMRPLSLEDRVVEVAKLMSGEEVTAAGLEGARELMKIRN